MEDKIILGGAVEGVLEQDYAGDISFIPEVKETFLKHKTQYQQGRNQCVLYAVIGCVADNTGIDFSIKDLDAMKAMLPLYGFSPNIGMYLSRGGDLVVDYCKSIGITLRKAPIATYGPDFLDILDMGYSVQFGTGINQGYLKDIKADGDVDAIRGTGTGHSRRIFKHTNGNYYIVENFVDQLPYNIVEVTPTVLQKLIAAREFFNNSFIYYQDTMETAYPAHKEGVTQDDKNIVVARKKIIDEGYIAKMIYTDSRFIEKMTAEIVYWRNK